MIRRFNQIYILYKQGSWFIFSLIRIMIVMTFMMVMSIWVLQYEEHHSWHREVNGFTCSKNGYVETPSVVKFFTNFIFVRRGFSNWINQIKMNTGLLLRSHWFEAFFISSRTLKTLQRTLQGWSLAHYSPKHHPQCEYHKRDPDRPTGSNATVLVEMQGVWQILIQDSLFLHLCLLLCSCLFFEIADMILPRL